MHELVIAQLSGDRVAGQFEAAIDEEPTASLEDDLGVVRREDFWAERRSAAINGDTEVRPLWTCVNQYLTRIREAGYLQSIGAANGLLALRALRGTGYGEVGTQVPRFALA